jgi:glycosyltransferase involved in cell wall biosynthesis
VKRGPDPLFVVLGDDLKNGGATRRAMEARVAAAGMTGRFRFLGFRKDAPRLVQAFDVIAVPSHVEPLGNATLEAMAAGRPVVGTRVGGIPEMVVDGVTGILVPPHDPAALAAALARIADEPSTRARMQAAARQRAQTAFSLEAHGKRLQHLYDSACGSVESGKGKEAA